MADGPAEADRPNGTTTWAVVVAGGSGARFGGYKQFMLLAGREVVEWSVEAAARACAGVVLVVPADWVQNYLGTCGPCRRRRADPSGVCPGGA